MLRANHPQTKRGSALLTALFIMTLVAIAATAMSTRLQLDIYRTGLLLTSDKLYLASQSVTFWAMNALSAQNIPFKINNKNGALAELPPHLQRLYPDVVMNGKLYDLQSQFNLNNLQDRKYHLLFLKLLENTHIKMSAVQSKLLINAILYWISPYQPGRGHDEYLSFYTAQKPSYLPAYQLMQSVSELRLVRGVSRALYSAMLPNLIVLPEITPININTAPPVMLKSLGNGLNDAQVEEIMHERAEKGISSMEKITELLQKLDLSREQITIESNYYLSVATLSSDDLNLTSYTVIKRSKDNRGRISVGIVRESLNTI
jgi:general secretion pathway protein K